MLFLPIARLLAAKRRLAPHPDPHYHRLARVMQNIPRGYIARVITVRICRHACKGQILPRRGPGSAMWECNKYAHSGASAWADTGHLHWRGAFCTHSARQIAYKTWHRLCVTVFMHTTANPSTAVELIALTTDRRFNRMRPSIAPRKRHQAG